MEPGEYAVIAVTDDGEGMRPEVVARAFEPFYTTKEVGKGLEHDLWIRETVQRSRLDLQRTRTWNDGTNLSAACRQRRTGFRENPAKRGRHSKGPRNDIDRVDDPFVRSSVIQRVEALGYKVVAAVNGNDALLKLRANPEIDMLFTDIVMPGGMSGWEFADQARQIRPGLPVVYSSGYALETLVKEGRAPVQSIILTKPYRKTELALRLREAFATTVPAS